MIDILKEKIVEFAPEILTGMVIGGVITSCALASKAGVESKDILEEAEEELEEIDDEEKEKEVRKRTRKKLVRTWLPCAGAIIFTAGCAIASNRISASRLSDVANVSAIASMGQTAIMEYKNAARKVVGEETAGKIDDEVIRNTDAKHNTKQHGDEFFCDSITGQTWWDTRNHVWSCWQSVADQMPMNGSLELCDFFYEIGYLEPCDGADHAIWMYDTATDNKGIVTIDFVPVYTKDGTLCNKIVYDRMPDSFRNA